MKFINEKYVLKYKKDRKSKQSFLRNCNENAEERKCKIKQNKEEQYM